jgi:hypothetical protein
LVITAGGFELLQDWQFESRGLRKWHLSV